MIKYFIARVFTYYKSIIREDVISYFLVLLSFSLRIMII